MNCITQEVTYTYFIPFKTTLFLLIFLSFRCVSLNLTNLDEPDKQVRNKKNSR